MSYPIKFQLNNKEAILDLIGKDPEFEIEIKKAILNYLGNNYVKTIANSNLAEIVRKTVRDEMKNTDIGKIFVDIDSYYPKLDSKGSEFLRKKLEKIGEDVLKGYIHEALEPLTEKVEKLLEKQMAEIVTRVSEKNIDRLTYEKLKEIIALYRPKNQ